MTVWIYLDLFDPATGFEVSKWEERLQLVTHGSPSAENGPKEKELGGIVLRVTFFVECRPVRHATEHLAHMDEIKMVLLVSPRAAAVIDLEVEINRGRMGLNGREVGSLRGP